MWDLGLKDYLNLMKMEKQKQSTRSLVREIKRKTRWVFSSQEKIQIVL